jgi:hypothetical protein
VEFLTWLSEGGFWDNKPRDAMDRWIESKISQGHDPIGTKSYARALGAGGNTTAETYGLARDFDCLHLGTAFERCSLDDLPQDRWFRNAWQRSQNGGPLYINMKKARKIQLKKLQIFAKAAKVDLQWGRWKQKIRSAETPGILKSVWPKALVHG